MPTVGFLPTFGMPASPIDFSDFSAEERWELIAELGGRLDPGDLPPPTAEERAEVERHVAFTSPPCPMPSTLSGSCMACVIHGAGSGALQT